jgi:uncharacterized protein
MAEARSVTIARPVFSVDNRDLPSLAEGLISLQILENVSGLYRCEAEFGNWGSNNNALDYLYFDRRTLEFGKSFKVKNGTDSLFDGRIMALEARFPDGTSPTVVILAEDRFQDLRMTRRTRTFNQVSDSDVIRQIAGNYGLTANVDISGGTHVVLAQVNQSDLAFLRERARAVDAEVWMDGKNLHVKSHARRNNGTLEMTYRIDLQEFTVVADLAGQRTGVKVSGWDIAAKNAVSEEADQSILSSELNGDTSGASILQSAIGARKEAVVHTVPLSSQEARNEAQAIFKMSARRFVTGQGVAQTNPKLRVGSYVNLKGLGELFNGKYYVTEVRHLFDGVRGIRTEFTAERPGIGRG